ncbi:hypothetical protein BGAL_0992g00020 [Botrytis galanthina]|uniref:Uncharacterized protein n=1 Tax=Botrytis galanthina TaxID=278940 RepID=A0A4S8QSV3_9HELO|nr:hypothetical protein BGAL_0992g00020 [Botrytis galanthina]
MLSTPSTSREFKKAFPRWRDNSIGNRTRSLESGSSWSIREIETFHILRKKPQSRVPAQLLGCFVTATAWIDESKEIQLALNLLQEKKWTTFTHHQISESAGTFDDFFKLLQQVLETPITPDAQRGLRSLDVEHASIAKPKSFTSDFSSSSPLEQEQELPLLPPNRPTSTSTSAKRPARNPTEHDQSSHDQRNKSENTTNACAYTLLSRVVELFRPVIENEKGNEETGHENEKVYLEWTITNDTFTIQAGNLSCTTKNDGSLVEKVRHLGRWGRGSEVTYCSLETKSTFSIDDKPIRVQAQEAAHLIGMFSQLDPEGLEDQTILPLISISQNIFSLILGIFPKAYAQYLENGLEVDEDEGCFVELVEFGRFTMSNGDEMQMVVTMVVALQVWLQRGRMGREE